ncbi:MAG TPA: pitrilysin family protein [Ignavibacteriaceae bacterium]|nr:pitrilysin family protein [Ignavibacteriaceae bacterium]
MDNYKKTVLSNGIKIISEKIPYVKSFSLGFWFNVGSRDEIRKNNGITHFIEHMLFKGTKNRSARKIAEDIESYGGYLNAFTSKEHTCYYGRGLEQHLDRTFSVLSDMIQNPLFKENEIKKEANIIIDELNDINDNPEELIFDKFEEILFEKSSLGLPIMGTEHNIKKFRKEDLFDFIQSKYGFNNMTIAASGAVEHEKLIKLAERYFVKDLGIKKVKKRNIEVSFCSNQILEKPVQQMHIILGGATYGYKDDKRTVVNVLSHILGEGSSSRLFQTVRERNGIAYQLNSFINSFFDISTFGVYLSTNVKQAEKAENLIFNEFKKLREKAVPERELKKAKEYIKGSLILSLESMSSRMFRMASSESYFDRLVSVDEMVSLIDRVTSNDILELSNALLVEDKLSKIVINPSEKNIAA